MTGTGRTDKRGHDVLRDPLLNKGTAFTAAERDHLGLEGLLPALHTDIETQARRAYGIVARHGAPLDRYLALAELQDRNETLFHRVLLDHLEEFMPVIYTPTVGEAAREYSTMFRRGRGVWITPEHRGRMVDVLRCASAGRRIRLLVATDNEAILGIGDQGAGGMAISVGKLALYTAAAGIAPSATLPVSLDVGTENAALRADPAYIGWNQPRLRGAEYEAFVDEFVTAVETVFPGALVQWEDLRKDNALSILERYRDRLQSFNDDVQGTGAVALAGLLSALRVTGVPRTSVRVVVHGAGAAGLGIARQLRTAIEAAGATQEDAHGAVAVLDSRGLIVAGRPLQDAYKQELAWTRAVAERYGVSDDHSLEAVIEGFRPHVLIGASGQGGAFPEPVVRAMARHVDRPVVLPFSNPTSSTEVLPSDVIAWTEGRALVATGSPFEPVVREGRTFEIGQGNNVFIFPGLGLGALLAGPHAPVTDAMLNAAAEALAGAVTREELDRGLLFPAIGRLREVTARVAAAVLRTADAAVGDEAVALERVRSAMWSPQYPVYCA